MATPNDAESKSPTRKMKKCPNCFTYIQLDEKKCPACQSKVGNIGKDGIAKKPVDWMSYFRAVLMWTIFGLYMWWAFLREK